MDIIFGIFYIFPSMKQLITSLIIILFLVSCDKDGHYDDVFEVHFKVEGKEYSKALPKNTPNPLYVSTSNVSPGNMYESQGAVFEINDSSSITLHIGNFLRKTDDNPGNIERLKQMLPVGNREYNLDNGDSSVSNGVSIVFVDGSNSYFTCRYDPIAYKSIPVTNEQTGSSFVINEIKQTNYIAGKNNAFIIKGSFNCNLFDATTGRKKVLTDGTFTCILSTR